MAFYKMIIAVMKFKVLVNYELHDMQRRERTQYQLKTESVSQSLAVNLQKVIIEIICHCKQNRILLRLIMKHVKTCTQ